MIFYEVNVRVSYSVAVCFEMVRDPCAARKEQLPCRRRHARAGCTGRFSALRHYSAVCVGSSSPGLRLSGRCGTARAVTGGSRGGEPVLWLVTGSLPVLGEALLEVLV